MEAIGEDNLHPCSTAFHRVNIMNLQATKTFGITTCMFSPGTGQTDFIWRMVVVQLPKSENPTQRSSGLGWLHANFEKEFKSMLHS